MTRPAVLSLDIGTSALKGVLFDSTGTELWRTQETYAVQNPREGYGVHDPAVLEAALWKVLSSVEADPPVPHGEVSILSITGLGTGFLAVDADISPVSMAMLTYMDKRTNEITLDPRLQNVPFAPTELLKYVLWVKEHDPATYDQLQHVTLVRDYIGYLLTGKLRRIGFQYKQEYVDQFCEIYDVPASIFPRPHEMTEPTGTISAGVPWEGPPDTEVIVCPWDGMCSVIGSGLHRTGQAMSVSGTTNIIAACLSEDARTETIITPDFLEGVRLYYTAGPIGVTHAWLKQFARGEPSMEVSYSDLDEAAARVGRENVPVFVPLLQGEAAKPHIRGGIIGLTPAHSIGHVVRSFYEGDSFFVRRKLAANDDLALDEISEIRISGGGSQSSAWNRIRANATRTPVAILETTETAALGAAILGAVRTDEYGTVPEAMEAMVRVRHRIEPEERQFLERRYRQYNQLYDFIDELYEE